MSTRRLLHQLASGRRLPNPYSYTSMSCMCSARTISENNHEKILRYVLRKELKSLKMKIVIDNKSMRYQELKELMIVQRKFIVTDFPGSSEMEMHRFMETETLMVKFGKDEDFFDVRISKVKEGDDSVPYYFVFKYVTDDAMQVGAHYYSYDVDEKGERRNFAARYNGIEEFILVDAEAYMTERGIDKELAEFVQLEIENKQRRERARCLKDIIGFLKKKVENGDDVPEIQS